MTPPTDSMLLTRSQIVDEIWGKSNVLRRPDSDPLDPLALRSLLLGHTAEAAPEQLELESFGSGEEGNKKIWWGVKGLPPRLLSSLPLQGHINATPNEYRRTMLAEAMESLDQLTAAGASTIQSFTSILFWLDADSASPDTTLLTSASLPVLPHATLITDKALRHIPPDNVYPTRLTYALQENLIHEALHQCLSATLLLRDVMSEGYDATVAPKVTVPWRGTSWEPDRVLHAVYVYAHLVPLRQRALRVSALNQSEREFVASSLVEAGKAHKYLRGELLKLRDQFTDYGHELVNEIVQCKGFTD